MPKIAITEDELGALKMLGLPVLMEPKKVNVKILKAAPDDEKRLVYGVVLQPMMIDLDGNIMTAEDVEFAAHHFMAVGGAMGDRHAQLADAVPVESYLAPCDFDMGGQKVLAGSWVLVSYVRSDDVWAKVKSGEYTGYSVGGFGKVTDL